MKFQAIHNSEPEAMIIQLNWRKRKSFWVKYIKKCSLEYWRDFPGADEKEVEN
jgi:hypothetical protein